MCKLHYVILILLCLLFTYTTLSTNLPIAKPGCETQCGNLTVSYPFGMGVGQDKGSCFLSFYYRVMCNITFSPAKLFIYNSTIEIMEIIDTKMRISNSMDERCYNSAKYQPGGTWIDLRSYPIVFNDTENKFTAIGCNTAALISGTRGRYFTSGCIASCSYLSDAIDGSCSGIGCCQTAIPKGLKSFQIDIIALNTSVDVFDINPCSYAFLGEEQKFRFNVTDLNDTKFRNRTTNTVPVVLEWYIGNTQTCEEAKSNKSSYACQNNTQCIEFESGSSKGYRCSCLPGYEGNANLGPAGCTDIDECAASTLNNCSSNSQCNNIAGSYKCLCDEGYYGDGLSRNGCMSKSKSNNSQFAIKFSLGMTFTVSICATLIALICFSIRHKKLVKLREKYFEKNGGILLKQQLAPYEGREENNKESFKIYTSDELRSLTSDYNESRIIGKGGYGIVYKGILKDGSAIAVKTSKFVDQTQIEQFINEVAILTQINHRNVVKLLGCCLETEVPILVYEYISNGTLFEHVHKNKQPYWLTWRNCVRLALEAADALSYLHSAASPPIIHRDVKSSNILIDDSFAVKVSDFGASRLIPIDETRVITSVLGTHGYLDPEYLQTSQLTEKSDVYSFGVLLAELLTKQLPLCLERKAEERNLAVYFLQAMKEDRLLEILDPNLVSEASEEQLLEVSKLVKNCLSVKGEERPTMKEVVIRLEGLKNQINHPWVGQNYEESTSLLGQEDLYPISSSDYNPSTGDLSSGHENMHIEMSYPR